jgi:hypothetical protein
MSIICPQCQTANSPKSRFCRTCGIATVSDRQDEAESDAPTMVIPARDATTAPLSTQAPPGLPPFPTPVAPPLSTPLRAPAHETSLHAETYPGIPLEATQTSTDVTDISQLGAELQAEMGGVHSALAELRDETAPVFACNFNRLFIEGYNTTFQVSLANNSPHPLEQIAIQLECGAWEKTIERKLSRLAPGGRQVINLDALPNRAGNFLLNCALKMVTGGRQLAYISSAHPTVTVMTKPDAHNMVFNIVNSVTGTSSGANAGLGAEIRGGDLNVKDLVSRDAIRSINDLLQMELPANFVPVDLMLDSELSISSAEEFKAFDKLALTIPREFVAFVQPGTILKLTPFTDGSSTLKRAIHLVARPVFRIGRRQDQSDMVTWFLPRSPANDGKTKRISSVHCALELRGRAFWLLDHNTPNYTTFDQTRVTADEPIEFNRRGVIGLAGEYFIDALPFSCNDPKGPVISNLRAWSGPQQTAERPTYGCVRFTPTQTEPAFHDAVWLPADGTFGTSRSNPIVFDTPGLAEIQGRFHHWRGCFWLENPIGNNMVRLASVTLKSNDMVPLTNGIVLELGHTKMRVEILA